MKPKFLVGICFLVLCAVTLVLAGCKPPLAPSTPAGAGSLQIALTNNIKAKTLVPSIDMTVASYTVTGTGPDSETFTLTSTGGTVTQDGLAFGSWTIVVNATNSSAQLVGTGTANAQVTTGQTTTVAVTVTPISGTGTLSLGVSWPASQVQTPSITASLTPAFGTAQTLPFTIAGATASYANSSVSNGYYTLAFSLRDNGITVAGAVEVVRIVTGQTTSGTYAFSNVNMPGGSIQVNINVNLQDPLEVDLSGGQATQSVGSPQTLTAVVSNYTGDVVYVWYVNGALSQAGGSSFTFGSGIPAGFYRIDVLAFTADGTQAGSATQNVQVTTAGPSATPHLYIVGSDGSNTAVWKDDVKQLPEFLVGPSGGNVCGVAAGGGHLYVVAQSASDIDSFAFYFFIDGVEAYLPTTTNTQMNAVGISPSGDVYVVGMDNSSACYWKNGVKTFLPSGGQYAVAQSIAFNGSSVIIGGMSPTPCIWTNGVESALSQLSPGPLNWQFTYVATANGHVYCTSAWHTGSNTFGASVWVDGARTDIDPGYGRDVFLLITGIVVTPAGHVNLSAWRYFSGASTAMYYTDGTPTDIDGIRTQTICLDGSGNVIIGGQFMASVVHGCRWTNGANKLDYGASATGAMASCYGVGP